MHSSHKCETPEKSFWGVLLTQSGPSWGAKMVIDQSVFILTMLCQLWISFLRLNLTVHERFAQIVYAAACSLPFSFVGCFA